ncbi:MAG TPA: hypothetical protein IAC02_02395 [Candidatus Coprovivens excrementavium]|nr:hypothetical protein [Candidatus Coprovivens excrementavium]
MNIKDTFKYLVGAYYGIREMDNYELKEYVLKDIENYIRDFVKDNYIENLDYEKEARIIEDEMELKTKLQDSLIVLPKVNAPMELVLLVKARLKELREEELENL